MQNSKVGGRLPAPAAILVGISLGATGALAALLFWNLNFLGMFVEDPIIANLAVIGGFACVCCAIFMAQGELTQQAAQENLLFQRQVGRAHQDELTGACSRSLFMQEMDRVTQDYTQNFALIQIDLDNLKQLNDGNGHACGDAALKHIINLLFEIFPSATIGRLGGDEFGIIFQNCESPQHLETACQQIIDRQKVPFSYDGRYLHVTATIGATFVDGPLRTSAEVLQQADIALYHGKDSGRNCHKIFEKGMRAEERRQRFIERELKAAVMVGELDVNYQPIYKSDGETLWAYEALVRWHHPVRGFISPAEFIPIAEQSSLVDKVSDFVLDRICRDLDVLDAPHISINISARQLRRANFAQDFIARVHRHHVDCARIAIEVTETVPLDNGSVEVTNLKQLQQAGFMIAIDDFGAGNASLSYIKKFDFNILKIDRSFVQKIESDKIDLLTVQSILRVARAAQMHVVVEGVETQEQFDLITKLGHCNFQGYLLGRPQNIQTIRAQKNEPKSLLAEIEERAVA